MSECQRILVVPHRYFDVKRQVKRKIARAARAAGGTGGGPEQEADLSDYEKELFQYLGPEPFQGVLGSTDTDVPIRKYIIHVTYADAMLISQVSIEPTLQGPHHLHTARTGM